MKLTVNVLICFVVCQLSGGSTVFSQMVSVAGGSFSMGNGALDDDEKPAHKVTVPAFRMDTHEVTEAQYDSCVRAGRCTPAHYSDEKCMVWSRGAFRNVNVPSERRGAALPVVCVTWFQAQAYCKSYGKLLPQEAQWEYAALAGKNSKYSWGDQPPSPDRCTDGANQMPRKVCSYAANAAGLFDMTGNVWEWVGDFYSRDYYGYSPENDPHGPDVGLYRVVRGGGWYSTASQLRVANRNWFSPDFAEVSLGFRCVSMPH